MDWVVRSLALACCIAFCDRKAPGVYAQHLPAQGRVSPESGQLRYSAESYSHQAIDRLRNGDVDSARQLFKRAMDSNHDMPRAGRVVLPVTPRAIQHGQEQVRKMLADRPLMAQGIDPSNPMYQWAVRKFAGDELGQPIDWDPAEPAGFDADHSPPELGRRGCVRIRKDRVESWGIGDAPEFERLWNHAVFELINITASGKNYDLLGGVYAGRIDRDQYVRRMFATELYAAERTRRFFVDVYLRHNGHPNVPTHPALWYLTAWGSDDELLQNAYNDRTKYPWIPYRTYFDKMKAQGFSAEASAECYRFAGRLHLARKDYASAMASFKRAREQTPQLAANRDFIAKEAEAAAGLPSLAEEAQAAARLRFQAAWDQLRRELDGKPLSLLAAAIPEPDGELTGEASAAPSDTVYAAIPVLEEIAMSGNVRARRQATILLEQLEQSELAVPGLAAALSSPESKVRQVAARKLKQFGPKAKAAVPALTKALADEDELVRWYVCDTLGAIGPDAKEAVPSLKAQLRAGKAGLQSAIAHALMRIEPRPASKTPQAVR